MLTKKNKKNQSLDQNRQIGIGFLVFFVFFWFFFFWHWFWPEFEIGNWFFWFWVFLVFLVFYGLSFGQHSKLETGFWVFLVLFGIFGFFGI